MHPLLDRLEASVTRFASHAAVSDERLELDYGGFRAVACGLAGQIGAHTAATRVGILAPTSSACAAAIFACWYAGKTPVPLNFMLAREELGAIIADAGLDLVLTIERFAPAVSGGGVRTLVLDAQSLIPGAGQAPDARDDDLAVIIYTSGTTGAAKGVELTFANITRNALASIEHARLSPEHVFLGIIPQFHGFGFTTLTVVPLLLGAAVHYIPRFTPTTVLNTIAQRRISVFITIASMFGALARVKSADPEAVASLELAISGGEPLPRSVAETFERRFGKRIHEGYGMSEASPVVALNTEDAYRPGSVGRPLPGLEVWAVDERGWRLGAGQDGELVIRGHCVMRGYRNQPDATTAAVRDGVLHTGDIGHVDGDGFVWITGRLKDLIIIGGENVSPREVEIVLDAHPAVGDAAVIGMPDALRGEVPVAFVTVVEEGAVSTDELHAHCRAHLAGYKTPRQIRIVPELPRGSTGKILKRALRQMLP